MRFRRRARTIWPAARYPIPRRPSVGRVTSEDISDEVLLAETKKLKIKASPVRTETEDADCPCIADICVSRTPGERTSVGRLIFQVCKTSCYFATDSLT